MPPPRDVKKQQSLNDEEKRVLADRYRVEKKLGSGNFGTAFLVTDLKDNEELKVLKEVSIGDMQSDESIESVHEANLLAKLDNPHILKYFDSFLDGEYFCIVTEYCEGGDLDVRFKKLKKENKRLSEEQVLDWTVQLLSAVNYMHSRRVLHRDLKARNIFLKNERIKIGDFGISRILQGTMDMASTFTGTPYYMSPEVLKHEGYNSKSDVWSIGCLLYEMCTYQHAFEGQGLMGVMYKIVEGRVPELPEPYSRELNVILKKIFRKDPNTRPSSTELLREPFIAEHIKSMIKRLEANKIDDLDSTLVIKNDRNEIAKALNTKVSLKELQSRNQLPTLVETSVTKNTPNVKTQLKSTPLVQQQQKQQQPALPAVQPLPQPQPQTQLQPQPLQQQQQSVISTKEVLYHDDDDDVRSGVNQPILRPKTSKEPPSPTLVVPTAGGKELTPKEKLLINKLKKADEEAAKMGQMAKENYEERILRDTFRREATIHGNASTWKPGFPTQLPDYDFNVKSSGNDFQSPVVSNNTITQKKIPTSGSFPYYPENVRGPYEYNQYRNSQDDYENQQYQADFENEDEGTILKTVHFQNRDLSPDNYVQISSTIRNAMPQPKISNDLRPIKPMKTKFEIDQAFDDDGIPSDPQLTNEYYKNFNDFENDSSPERKPNFNSSTSFTNKSMTRNSMSKTVAPKRRIATAGVVKKPITTKYVTNNNASSGGPQGSKQPNNSKQSLTASKTFSGNQPRYSMAARNEYEQLIDVMQNALAYNTSQLSSETFGDDSKTSVFGANARATKIQNLRAQAMRRLGAEGFEKCYRYLREQRLGSNSANVDENKIFEGLKQYTANPTDCFLVDQLLFLEEM